MANANEIVVTLPGQRRVDAKIAQHTIRTDQPIEKGGEDSAPAPFDLFLASIGTCAGVFVQGFCAKRGIPSGDIRITERPRFSEEGILEEIDLHLELPASFPEKYRPALVKVVEQCSVKRAILAQPRFTIRVTELQDALSARTVAHAL